MTPVTTLTPPTVPAPAASQPAYTPEQLQDEARLLAGAALMIAIRRFRAECEAALAAQKEAAA